MGTGCVSALNWDPTLKDNNLLKFKTICLDDGVPIGADQDPFHLIISCSISKRCEAPSKGPASVPIHTINAIVVPDHVGRRLVPGKCFRDLTRDPFGGRMCRDADPDKISAV
jgi:hypothetical protein